MGDQIIQWFCTISGENTIAKLVLSRNSEKSTSESCRMHGILMNDEGFGSIKCLKLKYTMRDQIIHQFCRIGSPRKVRPPSLICRNVKRLRIVPLTNTKCIES